MFYLKYVFMSTQISTIFCLFSCWSIKKRSNEDSLSDTPHLNHLQPGAWQYDSWVSHPECDEKTNGHRVNMVCSLLHSRKLKFVLPWTLTVGPSAITQTWHYNGWTLKPKVILSHKNGGAHLVSRIQHQTHFSLKYGRLVRKVMIKT